MFILVVFLISVIALSDIQADKYEKKGDAMMKHIASKKTTWTPKLNEIFIGVDEADYHKFMGVKSDFLKHPPKGHLPKGKKPKHAPKLGKIKTFRNKRSTPPANFDWRNWTNCSSVFQIRKQTCGDCWSVATTSAISDRHCIYTFEDRYFSARQSTACIYNRPTGGCDGGLPWDAADYYINSGLATGGDPYVIVEPKGCMPYMLMTNKSICPLKCDDNDTSLDLKKGGGYRKVSSVSDLQYDIYIYGPVVAVFDVYQDFLYFGDGIYQSTGAPFVSSHAVRLIGWGVENNVSYWIGANQWGTNFGENGYFRYLMGQNLGNIESYPTTSIFPPEAYPH